MFINGIKRAYNQIEADDSIPDEEKFEALLMRLGAKFLVSKEDRVYIFEHDGKTARVDAKHARAFHFKQYVIKDMSKLFHDFNL